MHLRFSFLLHLIEEVYIISYENGFSRLIPIFTF